MQGNGQSTSVTVVPVESRALDIERAPERVLADASKAARLLQEVLAKKPRKVMMNGEQYLEFEDWQTLGRFYGVTVKGDGDPEYVEVGIARGFKASAVVITRDGEIISRATAFCLDDEEKWGERPKYVYGYICKDGTWSETDPGKDQIIWEPVPGKDTRRPKKERRQMGMEQVPLFQLSSMAQTRAGSKAFRNVLSWVVVLAGYQATPAEELGGMADEEEHEPRQPEPPTPAPSQPSHTAKSATVAAERPARAARKEGEPKTRPEQLYAAWGTLWNEALKLNREKTGTITIKAIPNLAALSEDDLEQRISELADAISAAKRAASTNGHDAAPTPTGEAVSASEGTPEGEPDGEEQGEFREKGEDLDSIPF